MATGGVESARLSGAGQVRVETEAGCVRVVVSGSLDPQTTAAARELLLEALELEVRTLVLDLDLVDRLDDRQALAHLLDVAECRCWSARCRLEVAAKHPDVLEVLAAAGL